MTKTIQIIKKVWGKAKLVLPWLIGAAVLIFGYFKTSKKEYDIDIRVEEQDEIDADTIDDALDDLDS